MPAAAPTVSIAVMPRRRCDRARWLDPMAGATRSRRAIMAAEGTIPNSLFLPCSGEKFAVLLQKIPCFARNSEFAVTP